MADVTTVSFPFCYICGQTDGQLVRPCENEKCSTRAHNLCMKKNSKYGTFHKKLVCDVCTSPIIVHQQKTFNNGKCCISFFKLFYTLFLLIGGSISIFFLAFGKSIVSMINGTCDECVGVISGTMWIWIFPFIAMFWQFPQLHANPCCFIPMGYDIFQYITNRKIKYKYYVTMLIMYLLSVILVSVAHGFGQLVYKYRDGVHESFNIKTSFAGIVIYYIFIAIVIGILIIAKISQCIYVATIYNFSNIDVSYGVVVDDSDY